MKRLKQFSLFALLPLLFILGCKDDEVPVLKPSVSTTSPVDGSLDVATNALITVSFNKLMDIETLNSSTFTVVKGSTSVAGVITYADSTATFTPAADWSPRSLFKVTLTNQVADLAGETLADDYSFSFTTALAPDVLAPSMTATAPINNATDVAFDQVVSITFNEKMEASTINNSSFTLKQGGNLIAATVSYADLTASLTPNSNLEAGKVYTANVAMTATDESGNALNAAVSWSFTTDELPSVVSVTPLDKADNVALNASMTVTFSEEMDVSTINANTFSLKQGTTAVIGVVSYTNKKATFKPSSDLNAGLLYVATLSKTAKNLNGNALANDKKWEFTTDEIPTVLSVDPLNNENSVARNKVIAVTFSEAMNKATINSNSFVVRQNNTEVLGTIGFTANTARFIPNVMLAASATYQVTVTTAVKDVSGNALAANKVWTFTTGTATGLSAVNLRASANYVILAKTAINNIPTSAITGDLGLSPAATSYITGFALTNATGYATSPQVTGKVYAADMASPTASNLTTAVENMLTAYTDAAGRPTPDYLNYNTGNIGGQTLQAGLYKWGSTVTIPGNVTLSGTADDIWIFQIDNDLTMSANKNITLTGGAKASNVFWQVAGEVVIGAGSHFEGIILSQTGITLETGASLHGRALAQTAVILDQNAVTKPN